MTIVNLSEQNSVFQHFLAEIRDIEVQNDRMRFRRNLERMGEVIAYEISKELSYEKRNVTTPLGDAEASFLKNQPILATIFRAGLPLHQGMLNYFDQAGNAFISAYRKHHANQDSFEVEVEYLSSPELDDKTLIISDPMLATGSSMVLVYKALLQCGIPKNTHVVCAIASQEGVNYVKKHLPKTTKIWCGAIDDELTAQGYIVPGLGDAGDLAFGEKI